MACVLPGCHLSNQAFTLQGSSWHRDFTVLIVVSRLAGEMLILLIYAT